MESVVTQVEIALSEGASETTGLAVQVMKFDLVHHRHEDLVLKDNQLKDPEIPLRDISGG